MMNKICLIREFWEVFVKNFRKHSPCIYPCCNIFSNFLIQSVHMTFSTHFYAFSSSALFSSQLLDNCIKLRNKIRKTDIHLVSCNFMDKCGITRMKVSLLFFRTQLFWEAELSCWISWSLHVGYYEIYWN